LTATFEQAVTYLGRRGCVTGASQSAVLGSSLRTIPELYYQTFL